MKINSAKRRDACERNIINELKKIDVNNEVSVQMLDIPGGPDVILGYRGRNYLIEFKSENGKLNEKQQKWHAEWKGQVTVCRSIENVLTLLNVLAIIG